jgi:FlaA1/EpsC-like NDP-sugar epimerase
MHLFVRGSTVLLLLGDLVAFSGSLLLTLLIRYQEFPSEEVIGQHLDAFSFLFVFWLLTFLISGLYDRHISFVRKSIPALVLRVQLVNILLAALFFFVFPFGIEPKTNLAIYLVVSTAMIAFWRLYIYPLITTGKPSRTLVIGDSEEAIGIARVFASNPYFKNIRPFVNSKK